MCFSLAGKRAIFLPYSLLRATTLVACRTVLAMRSSSKQVHNESNTHCCSWQRHRKIFTKNCCAFAKRLGNYNLCHCSPELRKPTKIWCIHYSLYARSTINLHDVILPMPEMQHPPFNVAVCSSSPISAITSPKETLSHLATYLRIWRLVIHMPCHPSQGTPSSQQGRTITASHIGPVILLWGLIGFASCLCNKPL